jgi:hypothetical protein
MDPYPGFLLNPDPGFLVNPDPETRDYRDLICKDLQQKKGFISL